MALEEVCYQPNVQAHPLYASGGLSNATVAGESTTESVRKRFVLCILARNHRAGILGSHLDKCQDAVCGQRGRCS